MAEQSADQNTLILKKRMTKADIKKAIQSKADRIADALQDNKDVLIKKTKTGIKIQSLDYKRVI